MLTEMLKLDIFPQWRDYLELTKPRVILLMLLTAWVGMQLAIPPLLTWVPFRILFWGLIGIALCAGSAAVINHLVDQHVDAIMGRTKNRPLPTGRLTDTQALIFSITLGVLGLAILVFFINPLTAILTLLSLIGYAGIYTLYLKRATPQNIVLGGIAGATPPLLGWTAVTNHITIDALILVLIIFIWTPPHFWALAIYRYNDYAKTGIPMLPVTHGIPHTKLQILIYTIILFIISLLPFFIEMSGIIYLFSAIILNAIFLYYAIKLYRSDDLKFAIKTFSFSIYYLAGIFIALLVDHFVMAWSYNHVLKMIIHQQ